MRSNEFGKLVRCRREWLKLSVRDLAKRVNCSYAWLSKFERGIEQAGNVRVGQLADALSFDYDVAYQAAGILPPEIADQLAERWVELGPIVRGLLERQTAMESLKDGT